MPVGVNLRVSTDSKQGKRKYMEDVLHVHFEKGKDGKSVEYAYFAVFDGHGGFQAAKFAKQHLLEEITKHKGFWSDDDVQIQKAIRDGFLSTHRIMWKVLGTWPKTVSGCPSTSGTTASVVFIRNKKMYVAHVGDSTVVLGSKNEAMRIMEAEPLTEDHKPSDPREIKRIEKSGGEVMMRAGVPRVVWYRPRTPSHTGPIRRSMPFVKIPFLAVARALGDFWSYNMDHDAFTVAPEPDISVHKLDPSVNKCLILASDGLWNMVQPGTAVAIVEDTETANELYDSIDEKPASKLVAYALSRWRRYMHGDNTSVICVMIDPPGDGSPVHRPSSCYSNRSKPSDADTDIISDSGETVEEELPDLTMECPPEDDSDDLSTPSFAPKPHSLARGGTFWGYDSPNAPPFETNTPLRCLVKNLPDTPNSAPPKLGSSSSLSPPLSHTTVPPLVKSASLPHTISPGRDRPNSPPQNGKSSLLPDYPCTEASEEYDQPEVPAKKYIRRKPSRRLLTPTKYRQMAKEGKEIPKHVFSVGQLVARLPSDYQRSGTPEKRLLLTPTKHRLSGSGESGIPTKRSKLSVKSSRRSILDCTPGGWTKCKIPSSKGSSHKLFPSSMSSGNSRALSIDMSQSAAVKAPLEVNVLQDAPSAANIISPIWPSCLDDGLDLQQDDQGNNVPIAVACIEIPSTVLQEKSNMAEKDVAPAKGFRSSQRRSNAKKNMSVKQKNFSRKTRGKRVRQPKSSLLGKNVIHRTRLQAKAHLPKKC